MKSYFFAESVSEPGIHHLTWLSWLIIWTFVNVSPAWYVIYVNKKILPVKDLEPKYKPFARFDYKNWSYVTVLFTHFFFIPRFLMGCLAWASLVLVTYIVLIGHK